jgi:hypothetical protein
MNKIKHLEADSGTKEERSDGHRKPASVGGGEEGTSPASLSPSLSAMTVTSPASLSSSASWPL